MKTQRTSEGNKLIKMINWLWRAGSGEGTKHMIIIIIIERKMETKNNPESVKSNTRWNLVIKNQFNIHLSKFQFGVFLLLRLIGGRE